MDASLLAAKHSNGFTATNGLCSTIRPCAPKYKYKIWWSISDVEHESECIAVTTTEPCATSQ